MITGNQVKVVSGSASPLCVMPPGPCQLQVASLGTASLAYVGVLGGAGSVTSTNGFPVQFAAVPPVVIQGYMGSVGGQVSAIAAAGTVTLAWLLSTATGQTGP